jgi:hypothetical protein
MEDGEKQASVECKRAEAIKTNFPSKDMMIDAASPSRTVAMQN